MRDFYEKVLLARLSEYTGGYLPQSILDSLFSLVAETTSCSPMQAKNPPALFRAYPGLRSKISYLNLCELPTPVTQAERFGALFGLSKCFIKHDSHTGAIMQGKRAFGSNKPRKLEFLLADAQRYQARSVITFGRVASSHALATAIYAKMLGMKSTCILYDQPNSYRVRKNLLMHLAHDTDLHFSSTKELLALKTAELFLIHKRQYGAFPYIIPMGGSNALGALGFVSAAFELKEQIKAGLLPEPEYIFVAVGSAGMAAGLLLGLKAAQLSSKLIAVHIQPEAEPLEMETLIKKLAKETNELLHGADPSFPLISSADDEITVLKEHCGDDYGLFTHEAMRMKRISKETENVDLDGTYTGKACAGMLDYIEKNGLQNKTILFWNSFDGGERSEIAGLDYRSLPLRFHAYFQESVQPLDENL